MRTYPLKIIIETSLLPTPALKIAACVLVAEARGAFLKMCTGSMRRGRVCGGKWLGRKGGKSEGEGFGWCEDFRGLCVEMFKTNAELILNVVCYRNWHVANASAAVCKILRA